ncbi:hypothetical protein LJ656_01155 [Paraburkholderia sp. MMS20-SJTR3]|uniref:Uncharacterized protein n=1 Tax=Paraburkholderia sejongensis TaxID=2886946 RepID=A0ABS8JMS3_9BURK|nr:hypothetical protein [Paraburkholderia sp. MMS20-SJTR3]MCC8391184.1 hypothetical protein [Paraburkholderia sp. MMS20-SJTR3]
MDRRGFMLTSVSLAIAAGGAWPWFACAAGDASTARALAVVDSTLAAGDLLACYARQFSLPVFETGDDIGALWFATLAPLLAAATVITTAPAAPAARSAASLIGITRASDHFVLSRLALCSGCFTEHSQQRHAMPGEQVEYVAFALTPRDRREPRPATPRPATR